MAKTRLNQRIRCAIVNAILNDIPRVNYEEIKTNYIRKKAEEALPEVIRNLPDAYKDYLKSDYIGHPFSCYVRNIKFEPSVDDKQFGFVQVELGQAQSEKINVIGSQIRAALGNMTYVEDFVQQYPDLAKYAIYMQKDKPVTNLPAVQLTEQLVALGLPIENAKQDE